MRKIITKCLIVGGICWFVFSCNQQDRNENERLMKLAEGLVEQHPDSALVLLDSVNTMSFSEEQMANFSLIKVQARDNAELNLSRNIEIFQARDYFVTQNDKKKAAWAYFYSGRVLQSQDKNGDATNEFLTASEWAEKANDRVLLGLIQYNLGVLNFKKEDFQESIKYFKGAYQLLKNKEFQYVNRYKIKTLELEGTAFLFLFEPDSALFYYEIAYDIAIQLKDTVGQSYSLLNMAAALCEDKKLEAAKGKCYQALALTPSNDSIGLAKVYLNLADIHHLAGRKDSATSYMNQCHNLLCNSNDSKNVAYLYESLSLFEEENGNDAKALQFHKQYVQHLEQIYKNAVDKEVLDIQRRYQFDLLQQELVDQKQQKIILILFVLIATIILVFWLYRKKLKSENTTLQMEAKYQDQLDMYYKLKDSIKESENQSKSDDETIRDLTEQLKLLQLQDVNSDIEKMSFQKKKDKLSNQLEQLKSKDAYQTSEKELIGQLQQAMDMIADMSTLDELNNKNILTQRKVEKIMKRINIDSFIKFINKRQPGFSDNLKQKYPLLNEQESNMCCLFRFGFNAKVTAMIMDLEINTIRQRRTDLRKKFNLESKGNIEDLLTNITS